MSGNHINFKQLHGLRATMKTLCVLALVVSLVGCSADRPHTATLTPVQATDLARRLANEKAEALYHCRPFSNGPSAQLVDGCWSWQDLRGQGQVDLQASVRFASNGSNPTVSVVLLDSRPKPLPERLR